MKRLKNLAVGVATLGFLMILGSLLHVPQWVAKAAGIYSSPVSNIIEAYGVPYQSGAAAGDGFSDCFVGCNFYTATVPAGYRLFVKQITVAGNTAASSGSLVFYPSGSPSGYPPGYAGFLNISGGFFAMTVPVTAVVDGGVQPLFVIQTPAGSGASAAYSIHGVLVNCSTFPGGTCPAAVR